MFHSLNTSFQVYSFYLPKVRTFLINTVTFRGSTTVEMYGNTVIVMITVTFMSGHCRVAT